MANRRYIDFPIASSVGDSDIILIWQSGANKQTTKATFLSGLPENLDELNDVAISGLTNGQILRYDSVTGKWENTDQGNLDLNDLNDVSIVSPSNGQVLVYNSSTSRWENSSASFVPYTGAVTTVNLGAQTIQAGSFVKAGGTAAQFLKANGSVDSTAYGTGSVTSVALTMPSAFTVGGSPITTAGTLAVTGAGTVGQYIRGDGSLADFPESSGGGSSVSYYLNGSVNQGTIGGVAYKELNKVPILGAGTDFTINADGYIASFITDAGDPNLLEIPGGNWNFETYFSASSGGGSPSFYVELYKVNSGGTATLIASNSTFPELIAFGTNVISYFSTLAVPTTALALTDRLAIRYYVTHSGRTITLHTEDNHLCQIITTFTTGLTALNGLTAQIQNFAVGTSGTDFAIASATATHTFNLPTASATNRGALSSADWTTFNSKQNALTNPVTGTGTTNYLPKFTGTSTIGNSALQETSGNVGIGTTPTQQLTVGGRATIQLSLVASNNTGASEIYFGDSEAVYRGYIGYQHNGDYFQFSTAATEQMRITSSGNLLVGTTTDNGAKLQVSGTATITQLTSLSASGNAALLLKDTSANNKWEIGHVSNSLYFYNYTTGTNPLVITGSTGAATFDGRVGIGLSPSYPLHISSNIQDFTAAIINTNVSDNAGLLIKAGVNSGNSVLRVQKGNGSDLFLVDAGGNVLIGTTTDSGHKLRVNGTALISSSYTNFQTSSKTASSGGTITFNYNTDYNTGSDGDNTGGIIIINVNEASTNVANGNAVYIGTVINPRGTVAIVTQISRTLGAGITALTVSSSTNNITVTSSVGSGGNFRATLTFIGGAGLS